MPTDKIAITIDHLTLGKLDRLVKRNVFPSRSRAIQEAVEEKLEKIEKNRLAIECEKLDIVKEQALAEEGMSMEIFQWPEY